jgi:hypothetical protein
MGSRVAIIRKCVSSLLSRIDDVEGEIPSLVLVIACQPSGLMLPFSMFKLRSTWKL